MMDFDYHRPETLDEALALKQSVAGSRYVAGGTDMLVRIKNGVEQPRALISLRKLDELRGIERRGDELRIGAATPVADIAADPTVQAEHGVLAQAAQRLGSPQIRSSATVGGNLCNASPCADTATPLLVLEAEAEIAGAAGTRRVRLAEWFTGPGQTLLDESDILTALVLPPQPAGACGRFLKKGRVRMDLALVNVAAQLVVTAGGRCDKARLAAGAVGPVPLVLSRSQERLEGQPLTTERIAEAAQLAADDVEPIDDVRASAVYRRQLVGVYVKRALEALAAGGTP
ncbi:MAG: xanthine dehydrogenase family protein subunit M [Deltaproteobacteria bacterium]|jgi:carbon-monoxide dehydrogenase medium subunit|nr:xanthine dehydrogenase family protein subunit M [Deltaproteobacteria bacterium]MBW2535837.1 xanthine dehydrogenase family protein subunit M [Deltaproteobacteria bacterium]